MNYLSRCPYGKDLSPLIRPSFGPRPSIWSGALGSPLPRSPVGLRRRRKPCACESGRLMDHIDYLDELIADCGWSHYLGYCLPVALAARTVCRRPASTQATIPTQTRALGAPVGNPGLRGHPATPGSCCLTRRFVFSSQTRSTVTHGWRWSPRPSVSSIPFRVSVIQSTPRQPCII